MRSNRFTPLFIIIIAFLIIVGGFYVYQHNKEIASAKAQLAADEALAPKPPTPLTSFNALGYTFQMPADWTVSSSWIDQDTELTPPFPVNGYDKIMLKVIKANCDSSYLKCNYIDSPQVGHATIFTYTTDPDTQKIYKEILDTLKFNGVKAIIRSQ